MSRKSKKQQNWRAQLRQRGRKASKVVQTEQKETTKLTWDELHAQEKYYAIYPGLLPSRLVAAAEVG